MLSESMNADDEIVFDLNCDGYDVTYAAGSACIRPSNAKCRWAASAIGRALSHCVRDRSRTSEQLATCLGLLLSLRGVAATATYRLVLASRVARAMRYGSHDQSPVVRRRSASRSPMTATCGRCSLAYQAAFFVRSSASPPVSQRKAGLPSARRITRLALSG